MKIAYSKYMLFTSAIVKKIVSVGLQDKACTDPNRSRHCLGPCKYEKVPAAGDFSLKTRETLEASRAVATTLLIQNK